MRHHRFHQHLREPYLEDVEFGQKGEFCVNKDFAFRNHLRRLNKAKEKLRGIRDFGLRLRLLFHYETFWYN